MKKSCSISAFAVIMAGYGNTCRRDNRKAQRGQEQFVQRPGKEDDKRCRADARRYARQGQRNHREKQLLF